MTLFTQEQGDLLKIEGLNSHGNIDGNSDEHVDHSVYVEDRQSQPRFPVLCLLDSLAAEQWVLRVTGIQ